MRSRRYGRILPDAHKGFTFVELIISIIIIGIGVTGILLVYTVTVGRSADPMIQHQAVAIAESYLEEILLRPFSDPDGVGGETRPNYDDINDYDGLNEPPTDQFGNLMAGLGAYTVSVTVNTASNDLGLGAGNEARITVTVTHPGGINTQLTGYRTNY